MGLINTDSTLQKQGDPTGAHIRYVITLHNIAQCLLWN